MVLFVTRELASGKFSISLLIWIIAKEDPKQNKACTLFWEFGKWRTGTNRYKYLVSNRQRGRLQKPLQSDVREHPIIEVILGSYLR